MAETLPLVKVAIVAENASTQFGGESMLPYQIYRHLRAQEIPTYLITHARCRENLKQVLSADDMKCIFFTPDTWLQKTVHRLGSKLPQKIQTFLVGALISGITARNQKKKLKELIYAGKVNIVHQPTPVSPRVPSPFYRLGVPVVIGPMNGNMTYPDAFKERESKFDQLLTRWGRPLCSLLNWITPGKLKASRILVANERTAKGLPAGIATDKVISIPENGVSSDFSDFDEHAVSPITQFIFVGRLEPVKALDVLLEAYAQIADKNESQLVIVGSGHEENALQQQAKALGLGEKVRFTGFLPQDCVASELARADVFVFPSIGDCGGAVVLEAMAMGMPIVATDWGGPQDYVDTSCGILVAPTSRQDLADGFANAMQKLAADSQLRKQMGKAGKHKVDTQYRWNKKVEQFVELYQQILHVV